MPQTNLSCQNCVSVGPCGPVSSPLAPDLALTYAHLRHALVASLPMQAVDAATPLASWRPNSDLGQLLLESWAYVGDILGTYAHVVATESYLKVAEQRPSQRRITALLGYQPRPAAATSVAVATHVDALSVSLGRTGYRAALPNLLPQVFESVGQTPASRAFNELTVAPVTSEDASAGDGMTHLIDGATAAAVRGRPVAFIWVDKVIKTHATEIVDVDTVRQNDGREYVSMRVAKPLSFDGAAVQREEVSIQSPSQRPMRLRTRSTFQISSTSRSAAPRQICARRWSVRGRCGWKPANVR